MYSTTTLEDWINNRYISLSIKTPQDIHIKYLAYHHNMFIHYRPMPSRYDVHHRYRGIVLDKNCTPEKQREQFFLKLCHIFRHVVHQTMMPEVFRELKEWDANHFTCMQHSPTSWLKNMTLIMNI